MPLTYHQSITGQSCQCTCCHLVYLLWSYQAVIRQSSGSCQAVVRQSSGSCQAVVRNLSGIHNLFMTSKDETTNSLIHEFKVCCINANKANLFLMVYVLFLIYYFKKHVKPCFFLLKTLKDILQHFKFVNCWIRVFVFLLSRTGY